jgi:hypothetical protein
MKKFIILAASLSLSLTALANVSLAQDSVNDLTTNADGSHVTSTAGVNPTANGAGGTIIYGDINTGPGNTVITPPSVVQTAPPPAPVVEPIAEPVAAEPAPVDSATSTESAAVATDGDQDGDNLIDAREYELGLDPANADADGDGVADGDEVDIYGTDPWVWDTDGDGIADGEELFGIQTDPLVWDDISADAVETVAQQAAEPQSFAETTTEPIQQLNQGTNEEMTATDGDASVLGNGDASAAPGTVTRGGNGTPILGPDGTYRVTETAPPNVTVSGDTEVLSPPATAPTTTDTAVGCDSYASWYDAQMAYEAAGLTSADPAMVSALDPDNDGIACEEGM